jgi:hypothetical protein
MKTFFGGGWGTGGRERRWGEVAQTMYTQVSKGKNDKIKNNNKKEKKTSFQVMKITSPMKSSMNLRV